MNPAQQILLVRHASPSEAIQINEVKSLPPLEPDEVRIRLIASPIHPSDLGVLTGSYGRLPELPAVPGREGLGEIIALGENVDPSWLGTQVRIPSDIGAWQEVCVAHTRDLQPVPPDLPVDMAAMAFVNPPTAWRLLHDFVKLQKNDWIIQNAANSAVGICVIQLAKHFGYKTLNIVRGEDRVDFLKRLGGDVVVTEDSNWYREVQDLTQGSLPKLAFNSVGGPSAVNLVRALAPGGTHITFGGMSKELVYFPTRFLIFNDVILKGFWLDKWLRTHSKEEIAVMYEHVFKFIKDGVLNIPVEKKYHLNQALEALEHAQKGGRNGKILFQSHWWPNLIA